jgi:hypothetical protein
MDGGNPEREREREREHIAYRRVRAALAPLDLCNGRAVDPMAEFV